MSDDPDDNKVNHDGDVLPVPAGPFRAVLGLVLMALGFAAGMGVLSEGSWIKFMGWTLFIGSFLVMTKSSSGKPDDLSPED